MDEHGDGGGGGIIGDWMPPSPSPSPRSLFSAILGYDPPKDQDDDHNTSGSGFTFPGPDKQFGSQNENVGSSSRSGLVQRMAARAGYNAPRLNVSQSPAYLTIPPGLSPTSLLDSPVFLSNSLVQPSPTTGKFPFAPNANANSFSDSSKDNIIFDAAAASSFAFKPVPESVPSSSAPVKVNNPPSMSWQSFPASAQSEIETDNTQNGNSDLFAVNRAELPSQMRPFGDNNGNIVEDQIMSNDGYNWRKYGQKQVKGSEYPRSYYKCTHPNCPVKKKVERSQEGHITEIIYKGAHNHPKPPPTRRSPSIGVEVSTTMDQFESSDAVDGSLTFSNEEEEEDEGATHGSVSLGHDGEGDESESKRRKVEADAGGCSRAMREPRVVVQTTSEVDILDDGYRWRKYGQKVVKGNPNPRSYYKCTSSGCTVRKHVERASHDLKSVITTYEGKHNHDVPAARNNNNNSQPQSQSQIHNRRHDGYGNYGYGYGMEGKMSLHQYMLPKGEPVSDPPSLYF